jgi:hypothetical protein
VRTPLLEHSSRQAVLSPELGGTPSGPPQPPPPSRAPQVASRGAFALRRTGREKPRRREFLFGAAIGGASVFVRNLMRAPIDSAQSSIQNSRPSQEAPHERPVHMPRSIGKNAAVPTSGSVVISKRQLSATSSWLGPEACRGHASQPSDLDSNPEARPISSLRCCRGCKPPDVPRQTLE